MMMKQISVMLTGAKPHPYPLSRPIWCMGATGLRTICSKFPNAVLSKPYTTEPTKRPSPVNKFLFEFDDKDLASEEALWDLYGRWIKYNGFSHTEKQKLERFEVFKESAFMVNENNKGYYKGLCRYRLCLNGHADGPEMHRYIFKQYPWRSPKYKKGCTTEAADAEGSDQIRMDTGMENKGSK